MSWCSLVTSTALEDILVNMACTHCYSVKLSRMALAPYPQKWSCETVYEKVNFMFTGYMSVMPATIQLDSLEAIVTLWWYFICRVLDPTDCCIHFHHYSSDQLSESNELEPQILCMTSSNLKWSDPTQILAAPNYFYTVSPDTFLWDGCREARTAFDNSSILHLFALVVPYNFLLLLCNYFFDFINPQKIWGSMFRLFTCLFSVS